MGQEIVNNTWLDSLAIVVGALSRLVQMGRDACNVCVVREGFEESSAFQKKMIVVSDRKNVETDTTSQSFYLFVQLRLWCVGCSSA